MSGEPYPVRGTPIKVVVWDISNQVLVLLAQATVKQREGFNHTVLKGLSNFFS